MVTANRSVGGCQVCHLSLGGLIPRTSVEQTGVRGYIALDFQLGPTGKVQTIFTQNNELVKLCQLITIGTPLSGTYVVHSCGRGK